MCRVLASTTAGGGYKSKVANLGIRVVLIIDLNHYTNTVFICWYPKIWGFLRITSGSFLRKIVRIYTLDPYR